MSKKKLPFGWAPAHWGLKGKLREIAKAEHGLEGEALERELLRINLAGRTEEEMAKIGLELDLKHSHITKEEYEQKLLDLRKDALTEKEYKLEQLELDKKHGKIDENEYSKQKSTLLDEPYVHCTRIATDPKNPGIGSFALDYNQAFVALLEEHGYGPAPNPEQVVDEWFTELCKNIALEAFDGIGDFNEKLDETRGRPDVIYKKDLKSETKKDD